MKIEEIEIESNKLGKQQSGCFSCFKDLLVYGDYDGEINLLKYPSLDKINSIKLFEYSCNGVQISDNKIICLGIEFSQSFSKPANWNATLKVLNKEYKLEREIQLKSGNWNIVKNNFENFVILYDSTEDQGVTCIDINSGEKIWDFPCDSFIRANIYEEELFLINYKQEFFILNKNNGEIKINTKLPILDDVTWNAAINFKNKVLLGGTTKTSEIILVNWDYINNCVFTLWKSEIKKIFNEEVILRAKDDEEDCGYDLSNVSNLLWFKNNLIIVVGGQGERLGACTSGCAIGISEIKEKIEFNFQEIDCFEGNTGISLCNDKRLLIDCSGSLKLLKI